MAPTNTLWNPYTVLDIDKSRTICYGWAPSQGRKCHNPVALANRQEAERLLSRISKVDPASTGLNAELQDLAHRILCKRTHQGQASGVVEQWKYCIKKHVDGKRIEENAQRDDYEDEIEAEIARLRELQASRRRAARPMEVEVLTRAPQVERGDATVRVRISSLATAEEQEGVRRRSATSQTSSVGWEVTASESRLSSAQNPQTTIPRGTQQPTPPQTPTRTNVSPLESTSRTSGTLAAPTIPSSAPMVPIISATLSPSEHSAAIHIHDLPSDQEGSTVSIPRRRLRFSELGLDSDTLEPSPAESQTSQSRGAAPATFSSSNASTTNPSVEQAASAVSAPSSERSISGDCSICYDSLLDGSNLVSCGAQCRQYFHQDCMRPWLRQDALRKTCPYFRANWAD